MNHPVAASSLRPWYRQLWPWLLISMPLTAVLAGLVTWYIAWSSNDGLVADDYYKQGLEINRSLASQETARQLGLAGSLRQAEGGLILSLKAEREISFPQRLRLRVLSPVRAGWDQLVWLERDEGVYRGRLESLPVGHWNLVLEDEGGTWKIPASALFPLQAEVSLLP